MKYDDCKITESVNFPNQNITRKAATKKKKINALDIFIVQALICVGISCGVMISRIIEIGF
ncbi:MAG: hypothetical protein K2O95_06865 [Clostridia bacterium]|nr:hypothetical protein [Clostridia bacterium]MDE6758774.1 hypothetical protein [Clostridia bacterium]MDE7079816.1 hypothetical protein [Clostridia bacterium]